MHEASTSGDVTHPGHVEETPHFAGSVWETFRWTGDLEFLRRNYEFCCRGVLDWLLGTQAPDGDLLPYGYGITEVAGLDLQCLDTAVRTATALAAISAMAGVLDDESTRKRADALRAELVSNLEQAFWLEEEGMYGDMLATPAQMVPRLEKWIETREKHVKGEAAGVEYYVSSPNEPAAAALHRLLEVAESDPEPDRKRAWLLKHWIVLTPLEAGLTDPVRATRTLARVEGPEFTSPVGMYLNGIDRTTSMSINTGALANAETRYGRLDQALKYVRLITDTLDLSMPGAISEISPDKGCFVQAWSGYAVAWPVVCGIFGLQPDAHQKLLNLSPQFPPSWSEARLSNVRIGGATFTFAWDGETLHLTASEPGWTIKSTGRVQFKAP